MKHQCTCPDHPPRRRTGLRYTVTGLALVLGAFLASSVRNEAQASRSGEPPEVKVSDTPVQRDGRFLRSHAPTVKRVLPSVVKVEISRDAEPMESGFGPGTAPNFPFFGPDLPGRHPSRPFNAPRQHGAGSGVIVTEDGYILTNNHVVEGADRITVTLPDEREFEAEVVGLDPQTDVAVLKIQASDLPAITLADSDQVEVGDVVLAVGNPFGLSQTVTSGIVSATGRATMGLDYEDFIQTDAAINPGNSGGALVDVDGRLIGINTAIYSRSGGNQGIGFAVPVNLARWVMDCLVENGTVERGFLGVRIQDVTADLARVFELHETRGALIAEVTPDSPADRAGLHSGDVILEFDGKPVSDSRRLKLAVGATPPGRSVDVKVMRGGKSRVFDVELDPAPGRTLAAHRAGAGSEGEALAGVGVSDLDQQQRARLDVPEDVQGAVVTGVDESAAAYDAGLRPGDIILEINRQAVRDAGEAVAACAQPADDVTLLKIWRDGGSLYLAVDESRLG